MKHKIFTLLVAVMASLVFAATATAQNKLFSKYADLDNVEYICITKSMLKLMGNSSANINGVQIDGITDALNIIIIVNTENKNVISQMSTDFAKLKDDANYEVLMDMRDDRERVTTLINNQSTIKEIVMYITEGQNESTFIVLTGKFTNEQLNKLINGMKS